MMDGSTLNQQLQSQADAIDASTDDAPLSDYWGHLDGDELGKKVIDHFGRMRDWYRQNGLMSWWRLKLHYYHNEYRWNPAMPHAPIMQQFGSQGEYQFVSLNNMRSVAKTILSSIVENPPSFTPRAVNTDADPMEAAALYNSVIDYYTRSLKLDSKLARAAELGMVIDSSFAMVEWDIFAQKPQQLPQAGNSIWQGDPAVKILAPWDVCYDWQRESWADLDWVIVRDWETRQKILAQFPEQADDIKKVKSRSEVITSSYDLEGNTRYSTADNNVLSEQIQVFKLFFKDSPWMPEGRFAMFLDSGKMLWESPAGLVYPTLPVEAFFPDQQLDALLGYSPLNEMVGPQEAINTILSSITTNAINYANQFIAAPQGTEINPKTLEGGHKLIEYPVGSNPPQGLNFTNIPDSLFEHLKELLGYQQTVAGVSNPSRGQTTGANMSGSAGLFLASQTAQNQGPMTTNFTSFSANVMTLLLHVLRVFGRTERTIEIMGKTVASKTIVLADELEDFDQVVVDETNPILDTPQGRMAFAQQMMQYGMATPTQVLAVATSGNLNAALDPAREKYYYIQKENQWLNEGKSVIVFATDDHEAHIMAHSELLNLPELRMPGTNDPDVMKRAQTIMQHVQQHMQMLAGNKTNAAQTQAAPGGQATQGSPALGTAPPPQPKDTGQVGANNPAQGQAVNSGVALPGPAHQPNMPQSAPPR